MTTFDDWEVHIMIAALAILVWVLHRRIVKLEGEIADYEHALPSRPPDRSE
jgi:hypothetical protein